MRGKRAHDRVTLHEWPRHVAPVSMGESDAARSGKKGDNEQNRFQYDAPSLGLRRAILQNVRPSCAVSVYCVFAN
jgi:hypothetical protein